MKIEIWGDLGEYWKLASGWWVHYDEVYHEHYFVAPGGVIYDRCGWLLCSRVKDDPLQSVQFVDIFTDEELAQYRAVYESKEAV